MKYKNNPLNIRYRVGNNWLGLHSSKKGFCEFTELKYGFRAALVLLTRYRSFGCRTVAKIIARWAPENDGNNTRAYAFFVAGQLGISVDSEVYPNMFGKMLLAMSRIEQGCYDPRWEKPLGDACDMLGLPSPYLSV